MKKEKKYEQFKNILNLCKNKFVRFYIIDFTKINSIQSTNLSFKIIFFLILTSAIAIQISCKLAAITLKKTTIDFK